MSAIARLDLCVLRWARTHGHLRGAEVAVAAFSALGEHASVWLAMGATGVALDAPRRNQWQRATQTVAAAFALNTAIKLVVRRQRPRLAALPPLTGTPTQLSFPSAHATASFAAALAYGQLGVARLPLYALAVALAGSRVYLGVHYPSDVIAGAALGTAVGAWRGHA